MSMSNVVMVARVDVVGDGEVVARVTVERYEDTELARALATVYNVKPNRLPASAVKVQEAIQVLNAGTPITFNFVVEAA